MHDVAAALGVLGQQVQPLPPRHVGLYQALGRRLAAPVRMDVDAPPFDRAMLDGYAVRSVDALLNAQLVIIGRIDAGSSREFAVGQGQCVAVNTGAPMPRGADAILMKEHAGAVPGHAQFVQVLKPPAAGYGVQTRASDAAAGQEVLAPGARLGPEALAVAAAAGAGQVLVSDPLPRVALLVTGDELVDCSAVPGPAQIRNSNHPLLAGLLKSCGAELIDLGTVGDDAALLRAAIARGLAEADVLIVTGGMSVGSKDLVPQLLTEAGVAVHIEKVKMKPGKPLVFGTREDAAGRKYVLGLPGNPVSAYVCYVRFGMELLRRLCPHLPGPRRVVEEAYVDSDLPENGDREFYQPCRIVTKSPPWAVTPLPWRGSADLFTLCHADALLIHPAGAAARPAQSMVEILHLRR